MADKQPLDEQLDKDLEAANKAMDGFTDLDGTDSEDDKGDKDDAGADDGASDDAGTGDDKKKIPDEDKDEDDDAGAGKSKKNDAGDDADEDDEDGEDGDDAGGSDGEDDGKKRPERFIPLKKYHDEKRVWEEKAASAESLAAKVKELEVALKATKDGSKSEDDKIKSWSSKHNMSEDAARELADIIREGVTVPKEQLDRITAAADEAKERQEQAHFDKEYKAVEPGLKTSYPDATPEQLEAARGLVDKLAHSKKYFDKDIDYVLFKEKTQLDTLFSKKAPARKGPENNRMGNGGPRTLTSSDFKKDTQGKYDFVRIDEMENDDERNRLVNGLSPEAYLAYVHHVGSQESEGLEINRGGRRIRLK